MCGLLGIFSMRQEGGIQPLSLSPQRFAHALNLMSHRGPDASFVTLLGLDGSAQRVARDHAELQPDSGWRGFLGHNRLAILDRSEQGNQPMQAGGQWLVFNGEIYNHQAIRQDLGLSSSNFQGHSDTETLLMALRALSERKIDDRPRSIQVFLNQLNGMFAVAHWDSQRQTLLLARDRYGMKPLYYTWIDPNTLAFASEIKSLLALGASKALSPESLSEYFTFQNILENRTLLKEIHQLPAGHWMQVDACSNQAKIHRYWQPQFESNAALSEKATIDTFHVLLKQAVERQLIGEVPIGSFLSSGMDSSAITALAVQYQPALHTYTAGFDTALISGEEVLFDERQVAAQLARQLHTQHHELLISSDALPQCFDRLVWHLDDPRVGISYPNYLINQLVGQYTPVVLSGVGSDELLAGYPWRYAPMLEQFDSHSGALRQSALMQAYYTQWTRLLTEQEKQAFFTSDFNQQLGGFSSQATFARIWAQSEGTTVLGKMLCFDFQTFLQGLFTVEDRLSMAHSVESRVPFLDNDLVDFCLRLPDAFRLQSNAEGLNAKWILKQALRSSLPADFLTRRKQGFTPPDATWYRTVYQNFIESRLLSERFLSLGIFEKAGLQNILDQHQQGQRNHRFLIWSLLCLDSWHRQFLEPDY